MVVGPTSSKPRCLPKVNHSDAGVRVAARENHVLRLDVSVHQALAVHEVEHRQDGADDAGRVSLGVPLAFDDAVEELASVAKLHDETHVLKGGRGRRFECGKWN